MASTTTFLFRVVVGLLFAIHGAASLFGVLGGAMGSGQSVPVGEWPSWWAALIQFVGGALVLLGLATRFAAVIASGSMAYAYFVYHQPEGLLPHENGGELAALFAWSFLLIAAVGPGRWALSSLFLKSDAIAAVEQPAPAKEKELASV